MYQRRKYYIYLNPQEYLLAVHDVQYDEQDGYVANLYDDLIVVAHVLFQSEEKGFADTLEADDMTDHIGRDAVHTIDFQHGQMLVVPHTVYP